MVLPGKNIRDGLSRYNQAKPLSKHPEHEQDEILVSLAERIRDLVSR